MIPDGVNVLRVVVTPDEVHDIPVRKFDELTVSDYLRIAEQPKEGEQTHELVSRVFQIPRRIAWAMKAHEVEALFAWYVEWIKRSNEAWASVKAVTERLPELSPEGTPWTMPQAIELLKEHSLHRTSITVNGVVYAVPQRLETDTSWGQWISLKHLAETHKGPEAAMYPGILALLCMAEGESYPVQGKDEEVDAFDARFLEWYTKRCAMFSGARMVDALACCAFFLSSSPQFSETMGASLTNCHNWSRRWSGQGPKPTADAGAPTP